MRSTIKIDYSDYPKSLISRLNEVYVFFNKISPKQYFIVKTYTSFITICFAEITHLLLCQHGFYDVSITLLPTL